MNGNAEIPDVLADSMLRAEAKKKYSILKYFEYTHLPEHLQERSKPFSDLAYSFAIKPTNDPAEIAAGLRKLMEAKDCLVRAGL